MKEETDSYVDRDRIKDIIQNIKNEPCVNAQGKILLDLILEDIENHDMNCLLKIIELDKSIESESSKDNIQVKQSNIKIEDLANKNKVNKQPNDEKPDEKMVYISDKEEIVIIPPLNCIDGKLYDDEYKLDAFQNVTIYQPILDYVLYKIRKLDKLEFSSNDVSDMIHRFYNHKINRHLSRGSSVLYARKYLEYLSKIKTVVEISPGLYKMIKIRLTNIEKYIILWSEKNNTDVLDINEMYANPLSEDKVYSKDDLVKGCDELLKKEIVKNLKKYEYIIYRKKI